MKRLLVIALLSAGCLDHELPEEGGPAPDVFIALQRDFAPLEQWPAYELGQSPLEGHPQGRRIMYVNHEPPPGAAAFPVGTTIAKIVQAGAPTEWLIHAMVKRGGEYNLRGARDWEWFELKLSEDRTPIIVWRGQEPPNGERYGCLTGNCENAPDCNQCHGAAEPNDFVMAEELQLTDR